MVTYSIKNYYKNQILKMVKSIWPCLILAFGFCTLSVVVVHCSVTLTGDVKKDDVKIPGSGDFCDGSKSGSDCKTKGEGCYYFNKMGVCAACSHDAKVPSKYSVTGCGLSTWTIVGIVFGVVAGLLIILGITLAICFCLPVCPLNKLCCRKPRQERLPSNTTDESGGSNEKSDSASNTS